MLNVQSSRSDLGTFDSRAAATCGAPLVSTFKPNCAFPLLAGTLEWRKAIKRERPAVAELESLLIAVVSVFHPNFGFILELLGWWLCTRERLRLA